MVRRRALLAAPLAAPSLARAEEAITITDVTGRTVRLRRPAQRIVLTQGRHLSVLALLTPDPLGLIVGWAGDLRQGLAAEYAQLRARHPQVDDIPVIGRGPTDTASFERILSLRPDLVLLSRYTVSGGVGGAEAGMARRLQAVGIPSAVIDFFANPLGDSKRSIAILGALIGRDAQAAAFNAFYASKMDAVAARLAGQAARPPVLVQAHAGGTACCFSAGTGSFNAMIEAAGGRNIATGVLPGPMGQLSLEYVLSANPFVYAATGGPFGGARGGVTMGAGATEAEARESLARVVRSQGLERLAAVREGRAHALWHGFNDTPAHFLAVEVLARWLHPEPMRGIDPAASLAELNARFLALPMEGTYWADLEAGA